MGGSGAGYGNGLGAMGFGFRMLGNRIPPQSKYMILDLGQRSCEFTFLAHPFSTQHFDDGEEADELRRPQ